jgi:lysozyme family protein
MTSTPFPTWWTYCQRPENDGQPLHDEQGDPGGSTAYGITYTTYKAHAVALGLDPSFAAFQRMTQATAMVVGRKEYWETIRADEMPGPAAILWCDFHFTSGGATRCLQRMLRVDDDGVVGPETLAALGSSYFQGPGETLKDMTAARIEYDGELRMPKFINGWTRRANDCLTLAMGLVPA